ncbi:MAG: hypothetical protein ACOCXD_01680 [Bacteroidota bacterium]
MKTNKTPEIQSNCASITKTESEKTEWRILYDFNECKIKNKNYIEITFDYDFSSITQKIPFDVSEKMVAIEINKNISFQSLERDIFSNNRKVLCMIPVNALSPLPFKIERVELDIRRKSRTFTGKSKDKNLPSLVFDNLNFKMQGKGIHYFKITFNESLINSLQYKSMSDYASHISGKIFYYGVENGNRKVYEFDRLPYSVDW